MLQILHTIQNLHNKKFIYYKITLPKVRIITLLHQATKFVYKNKINK